MKAAVIYASVTGNTEELAELIKKYLEMRDIDVVSYPSALFPLSQLQDFQIVAVGTYTWGNGEIPREMRDLYTAFEEHGSKKLTTGVFGTGDSLFPRYCGAVNEFRDMLYVCTNLAVTLKVELTPQKKDDQRCERFVDSLVKKQRESERNERF
ncbi:flavodoxin domain-containing protein [Bacillus sp. FJAT-44742]|uniref:flavodoxin domain-containing protein n=1 Tax=Bacillus sp. FJAT-44742 TaxID=2014005 RepID=UPI000C24C6C1|nr:flavodoxin domain-containing protein [Bacillus sp. FJAT-44742]